MDLNNFNIIFIFIKNLITSKLTQVNFNVNIFFSQTNPGLSCLSSPKKFQEPFWSAHSLRLNFVLKCDVSQKYLLTFCYLSVHGFLHLHFITITLFANRISIYLKYFTCIQRCESSFIIVCIYMLFGVEIPYLVFANINQENLTDFVKIHSVRDFQ